MITFQQKARYRYLFHILRIAEVVIRKWISVIKKDLKFTRQIAISQITPNDRYVDESSKI